MKLELTPEEMDLLRLGGDFSTKAVTKPLNAGDNTSTAAGDKHSPTNASLISKRKTRYVPLSKIKGKFVGVTTQY